MILMQNKSSLQNRFRRLLNSGMELPLYRQVPGAAVVVNNTFRGRMALSNAFLNAVRRLDKERGIKTRNDYASFVMDQKAKLLDRMEEAAAVFFEQVAIESLGVHKEAVEGGVRKIYGHPAAVVVPDSYWRQTAQESIAAITRLRATMESVLDRSTEEGDEYFGAIVADNGKDFGRRVSNEAFKVQSGAAQKVQGYAGVTKYVWRTMKDVRVVGNPVGLYPVGSPEHEDHFSREGQVFSWDSPPSDGHPGQAHGCRCQASPLFGMNNPEVR